MQIDHIGYAVKNIEKARSMFESLGYHFEALCEDTDRNLWIQFGELDGYRIELISPFQKSIESSVDAYLQKIGPTPYHICYRSDSFDEDLEKLRQQGFKVTIAPRPAKAFGGKRVVFLMNLQVGLIEVVED